MKILMLGGYGVFGGRLAHLIQDLPIDVLIAGRSFEKAQRFCTDIGTIGNAKFTAIVLDRKDIIQALETYTPDLVVDASGPFQTYGNDPYSVIRACIEARVHYMDFADAADFVFGVSTLDSAAKDAGVFALSGVSSFPVLTAAVLRQAENHGSIKSVWGGIAPSPYAGIGLNVMRAVVGYAGKPVKLWRNGPAVAPGLAETKFATISVPGHIPLKHLRFSLVDVPDLQVLPPEHPQLEDIWMGAGPVPDILHRCLNGLAKLRAKGWLPDLTPFAPLFYRILNLMKFGEHRGGMILNVTFHDHRQISWHLLAEGDDGPFIPSMAIEALIRKLLDDVSIKPGARPAIHALELSDYETLFTERKIYTGWRMPAPAALYPKILGSSFSDLPAQIQTLHSSDKTRKWTGEANVTPGSTVGKFLARLIGFPTKDGALEKQADQLHLIARHWRLFGIPMPRFLLPGGASFETVESERFHFNVNITAPLIGRIVEYRGWLQPSD